MKKAITLLLMLTFFTHFSYAKETNIRVWKNTVKNVGMTQILLELALDITKPEYGEYQLISSAEMEQDRALLELKNARLDVAHFVATAQREKNTLPIRVPLMQGILGYRLCLIKDNNQQKFVGINNKQQWIASNITIGQHHNWPDTQILKTNGINVQTTYKHKLLFKQLAKERFDCFARGISEINDEQLAHRSLGLVIKKNIIIHYPLPQFFFVNAKNPLLAERLKLGLSRLQKTGKTKKLFDYYFQKLLTTFELQKRTFIELNNPLLSAETTKAIQTTSTDFEKQYLKK